MAMLLPQGKQSYTNSAGAPLVGGKLYTYDAGTSTPRLTFSDSLGTVANTNPVILDSRGEAVIFWSGAYKIVLKDAADNVIWSVDGATDPVQQAVLQTAGLIETHNEYANAHPAVRTAAISAAAAATKAQLATHNADPGAHTAFRASIEAAVAANAAAAAAARDAALLSRGVYASTANALSKGVKSITGLVAGSGGTNGTFNLAFSGGAGTGAAGYFVVSGGAVTSVVITTWGYGYTAAPTISFAASAGLTGASATAVISQNVLVTEYFSVPVVGTNDSLILYRVDAGPVATEVVRYASASVAANVRQLMIDMGMSVSCGRVTVAAGSITPSVYQGYSFVNGTAYQHTAVLKMTELPYAQFLNNISGGWDVTFNLSDGTFAVTTGFASMKPLGGGWYECSAWNTVASTAGNNAQILPSPAGVFPFTGDGASGMLVSTNILALYGTTTNLWASSDINDASFTKASLTATAVVSGDSLLINDILAAKSLANSLDVTLNGQLIADKFAEQTGSGTNTVYRVVSFTSGQTYRFEVIAKKAERSRMNLFCNGGGVFDCTFDLNTGTASGTGASITALGNGWYSCVVAGTAGSTAAANAQIRIYPSAGGQPYVGDGVSSISVYSATMSLNGGSNIFTDSTNFASTAWSKIGTTVTANVVKYLGLKDQVLASQPATSLPLSGKKIACIGTSITAQAQYTVPLASITGATVVNLGTSGGSLASGSQYGSLYIYNAISTIPVDSDVVYVEAGTNDFGTDNSTLGALGDTTTATFYGAILAAIVAIQARAPNAKIVFATPYGAGSASPNYTPFRTNSKGYTLKQFQDAVLQTSAFAGFACVDVGNRAGIGYYTAGTYTSDGLHINATGGLKYANFLAQALTDLCTGGLLI